MTARGARDATRAATLARLASEPFDLLVVGGGATGAAIARDAALRGLSVALVDAGDFAGQTSSHSSKLIHGGLRYLQYGDLPLVFEGLRERRRLMSTAPHLCRPIEFVFPGYRGESPGLVTLGAGIALYNALALWRPPAASRRLDAHALYALSPHLRSAGLEGAQIYVDCQTDDARLVLENVLDAEAAGAAAANHLAVERIAARSPRPRPGRPGRRRRDRRALRDPGPPRRQRDRPLHRRLPHRRRAACVPTLGVHLVFDAARVPHGGRALVLRTPQDNRLYFVLPAGARTIVGTTDTDFTPAASPGRGPRIGDEIRARGADVAYLLEAARHAFPALGLGPDDVVSTYAGLRPLLAGNAHTPSETSREHEISRTTDGIVVVAGGKLTTLRRMAEETVDLAVETLRAAGVERPFAPCETADPAAPGRRAAPDALAAPRLRSRTMAGAPRPTPTARSAERVPGDRRRVTRARRTDRSRPPLPLGRDRPRRPPRARPRDLTDVLIRRVPIFRDAANQGLGVAAQAATLAGRELGWDDARRDE